MLRLPRRPSTLAFLLLASLGTACLLIFALSGQSTAAQQQKLLATQALVAKLGLTDLALFKSLNWTSRNPPLVAVGFRCITGLRRSPYPTFKSPRPPCRKLY